MSHHVLLVEDDVGLASGIKLNLELEGYRVTDVDSAEKASEVLKRDRPDCVVLDVSLPGEDGFAFCRRLRRAGDYVPILFLTARDRFEDRIRGLDVGADDYLTKPFHLTELLTRIGVLLRRQTWTEAQSGAFQIGEWAIDLDRLEMRRGGKTERLRRKEGMILKLLADAKGAPVSRAEILDAVWGQEAFPTTRTVDNFILSLRKRLEPDPAHPLYIVSVHGVGYQLRTDGSPDSTP